jgi:hypothetical protein
MAFTRAERRDIFRATVLRWYTPLVTPRISSGCAALRASAAFEPSPVAIFDPAQEGADARAAGLVDFGTAGGLAGALLGLGRVGHAVSFRIRVRR